MKIAFEKTITEKTEVEITLPCYRTDNICNVYKVYSETECLKVCYSSYYPGVEINPIAVAFGKSAIECTKHDYDVKFEEICNLLINK